MERLADIRATGERQGQPLALAGGPLRGVRLVLLDAETAFTRVLANRAVGLRWQCRTIPHAAAPQELAALDPEALLVDPALFGEAFWAFLADVLAALPRAAIVVAATSSTVADRVRALRMGADDWVTKPVHPDEAAARVEAIVRRRRERSPAAPPAPIHAGELEIRPERFQAYVDGESVGLTRREYELLEVLARAEGRVLEREQIYELVWGYSMVRGDRSVDVFVGKVRNKLAARSPGWDYIHTHVGVGYRFGAERREPG